MARYLVWILGAALCAAPGSAAAAACEHDTVADQGDAHGDPASGDAAHGKRPARDEHRPWKFWQGESAAEIGITSRQATEIEQIFQSSLPKLESAKDRIDKLEATLSKTIHDNTADLATVAQQVDRLEAARADLYKTRTLMLYRMRAVLSADQRGKLQALWEAGRSKNQGGSGR